MRQATGSNARAAKSVTDHTSPSNPVSATIGLLLLKRQLEPLREIFAGFGTVVCHFCGRQGRLVDPFAEPG
jgi:hypothetical protein